MQIEINITADIITAIADDLKRGEKAQNLQLETIVFLQNVLKTTSEKAEKAVTEIDDIVDALDQMTFFLAGNEE